MLLRHPGKLLSQQYLLKEVWGPGYADAAGNLRLYMAQLRRKLEPDPARPRWLITEPGMGYRFQPDPGPAVAGGGPAAAAGPGTATWGCDHGSPRRTLIQYSLPGGRHLRQVTSKTKTFRPMRRLQPGSRTCGSAPSRVHSSDSGDLT